MKSFSGKTLAKRLKELVEWNSRKTSIQQDQSEWNAD